MKPEYDDEEEEEETEDEKWLRALLTEVKGDPRKDPRFWWLLFDIEKDKDGVLVSLRTKTDDILEEDGKPNKFAMISIGGLVLDYLEAIAYDDINAWRDVEAAARPLMKPGNVIEWVAIARQVAGLD